MFVSVLQGDGPIRLMAGADPGFFLGGDLPLRNGVTKNTNTKKAFD